MCSDRDHGRCMANATRACEEAIARGASLVVLPENYAGIAEGAHRRSWACDPAAPEHASAIAPLLALTTAGSVRVIAGGTPEIADEHRVYNTAFVLGEGRVLARYRKLHLFDADVPGQPRLRESDGTASGDRAVLVHGPTAAIGLSICYDLRFAELYRALVEAGAELLAIPSAFTRQTGAAHWEPLVRARAIETQCFVLAAAQHGEHGGGRSSHGHAMIVDPWGRVLAEASGGDEVLVADLDPVVLEQARTRVPALRHRIDPARLRVEIV
ncbi:MAG: carbon-nitrogen hydrolase family protein [Deltaproteobacteria bacterium]|nr:carbon-nitrogen hydrolase family protein [Nannocystaceae bacterium]